jgi:hypothetical protein
VTGDQITGLWFELQRFSISIREVPSGLASSPGSHSLKMRTAMHTASCCRYHAPYSCTHICLHDIHPILASSTQPPDVAPVRGSAPQRISSAAIPTHRVTVTLAPPPPPPSQPRARTPPSARLPSSSLSRRVFEQRKCPDRERVLRSNEVHHSVQSCLL